MTHRHSPVPRPASSPRATRLSGPRAGRLCGHRWQRLVDDVAAAMAVAHRDGAPLTLALFDAGVRAPLASLLRAVAPEAGRVYPLGDDRVALLLPGLDIDAAVVACTAISDRLAGDLGAQGGETVVGVVGLGDDRGSPSQFVTWAAAAVVTARRRRRRAGPRLASVTLA